MNERINHFKSFLKNKKVAVLGVGISNRPLIRYIAGIGCDLTAFDQLEIDDPVLSRTREAFAADNIQLKWQTGKYYLDELRGYDVVFRTPKMRWDLPQLLAERERGAVITSEMEVFMELCPAKIFGITGSDGKTTTTTLIALILEAAGYKVHVGGNIGNPLLDHIEKIKPQDMVVLELSSFQLGSMRKSPQTAVITNITPNHLDVHRDYQDYIDAKKNILLYQPFYGRLILNADNYAADALKSEARGEVEFFSRINAERQSGFLVKDGYIIYRSKEEEQKIVAVDEIKLPGQHNIENYLAAAAAVWPWVEADNIASIARSFAGVAHRLELVRELDGVRYFNSSIDTSPTRTKAALKALAERDEKVVLITGGQDKKSNYIGLGEAIVTVSRKIILCGTNSDLIEESINREAAFLGVAPDELLIVHCDSYEQAVQTAREISRPGEIVVLSPAGTSFDKFRHFEERGDLFRELVNQLQ